MNREVPLNILLVDDEPEVTELLSFSLRREPYTVRTASSGRVALELSEREPVDILVTDIRMPGMDGMELIEKMRVRRPDLQVIVISAHGDVDMAVRAMKGGAVDFLQKPVNVKMLKMAIDLAAEKWELLHELETSNQTLLSEVEERRRVQVRLEEEKELLAVTLRSIGDGVIATDVSGRILLMNKVAENLTGWCQAEAEGHPLFEVFAPRDVKSGERFCEMVESVIKPLCACRGGRQGELTNREGRTIIITASASPIMDRESVPVGMVCVFRDITQQQRVEKELIRMEKLEAVGVLAGGIAHDFNNILSGILGNLELAGYRTRDRETRELLDNASRATRRAAGLTRQLLTFSRGGDPVRESTSLPELIRDCADFVLQGSASRCTFAFVKDLWPVDVDAGQIGQVIQNIVINADHAMPSGGIIHIRATNVRDGEEEADGAERKDAFVRVTITDAGVGIPAEIIDRIFDPYFSTKQHGSGLGLAVCHSIVTKHGGRFQVESTPGRGTTFTLYLPAAEGEVIGKAGQQHQERVNDSRNPALVMVMDDEKMLRNIATSMLETMGHETVTVASGGEALEQYCHLRATGRPVDLVIMDLTIPGGMGGRETMEKLLEIDPEARVIVSSGYSNDPVMADYARYGFTAAIAKPFDMQELCALVDEVIRR